jgi:hypothetical protein
MKKWIMCIGIALAIIILGILILGHVDCIHFI